MKKNIGTLISELIVVIAGILIALFINNWNEERKDKAYIDKIFLSINKELTETNEDITRKLVLQQAFVDTLNLYLDYDSISLFDITLKAERINMPFIKINSWKSISNSKIELIEYEKMSSLAAIEERKELLGIQIDKMIDYFYLNADETGRDKKELIKIAMLSIIGNEKPLQQEIEKIIND